MGDDPTTAFAVLATDAPSREITSVEGRRLTAPALLRVLVRGERLLVVEVTMPAGAGSPPHRHRHESAGYVVRGRAEMLMAGHRHELEPGDAFRHPAGVEHAMRSLSGAAVWIEVKSPPEATW
jgi:quercetin dioxygenase-like cupin family protein